MTGARNPAAGGRRTAFFLDVASCSGCKACQVACKDRNRLPVGILWRRVYEVAGGGWFQDNGAWQQNVFAYNLSISCNHCDEPICAEVCPSGAIMKRSEDGLVLIDEDRCLGCNYCAWACPYGAPQFRPDTGRMTKCDFCATELEQGRPPVCVAACPARALEFGDISQLQEMHAEAVSSIRPLPEPDVTQPALVLGPRVPAKAVPPSTSTVAESRRLQDVEVEPGSGRVAGGTWMEEPARDTRVLNREEVVPP